MYSGMHIVRENMVGRNKNMRPDIYKKEIQQVESKKKLQQAVEGVQTKRIMHQMKKDHQGS